MEKLKRLKISWTDQKRFSIKSDYAVALSNLGDIYRKSMRMEMAVDIVNKL